MKKIFVLKIWEKIYPLNGMLKKIIPPFCCLLLISCAHKPVQKISVEPLTSATGTILNASILAKGGKLALMPFRAGPQAEANDELDRLSMAVLRGIKDSLDEQNTALHVITDESQGQPQMVLQGYVQEYSKTGHFSRIMRRSHRDRIVLEGEIWLEASGERLLNFSLQRAFDSKKNKPMDVAYAMGKSIGDFIAKQMR